MAGTVGPSQPAQLMPTAHGTVGQGPVSLLAPCTEMPPWTLPQHWPLPPWGMHMWRGVLQAQLCLSPQNSRVRPQLPSAEKGSNLGAEASQCADPYLLALNVFFFLSLSLYISLKFFPNNFDFQRTGLECSFPSTGYNNPRH